MKENFKIILCLLVVFVASLIIFGTYLDAYSQGILTNEKNIVNFGDITTQNPKQITLDVLGNILGDVGNDNIKINSLGFRGEEFSATKDENTFRIILLGGSQMFGTGATSDNTTIPGFLKNLLEEREDSFSIEVINAGLKGVDSTKELLLLQNMIVGFSPDIVAVYDGLNDLRAEKTPEEILHNWNAICEIGAQNNFNVIILLQPIAGFGEKNLSPEELLYVQNGKDYKNNPLIESEKKYQEYAINLEKLEKCTDGIDLRYAFDNEAETIYIDEAHVSDYGNSIISEKIFDRITKLIPDEIPSYTKNIEFKKFETNVISEFESVLDALFSNFENKLKIKFFPIFENDSTMKEYRVNSQILPYENSEIQITIEISEKNEFSNNGTIKISTLDKSTESILQNVTYLMTITKNDDTLFTNYFFAEDQLIIHLNDETDGKMKIFGERKYEYDALTMNPKIPISISGSFLEPNSNYEFEISLRSIHDSENLIFLNGFYVELTT
tara:strand:+ start:1505 stop:2998 length:1494 start_codon:yes stop_codon:yes gene_type:complete